MASNPQHEPTMEEILASIRKIISEDTEPSSDARAAAPPRADADADVLELSRDDVLEELPPAPAPVMMSEPVRAAAPPPSVPPPPQDVFVSKPIEEPPVSPTVSPAVSNDTHSDEGFLSDSARDALHKTFARLEAEHSSEPTAAMTAAS